MLPTQHSIYIWGHPCVWCCLTPLCFLALLTGTRSREEDRWGLCRASERAEQKKRFKSISKHRKKESESHNLYWERCTSFTVKQTPNGVHKAPLSPLLNPSVLHVWCLCLDSCTIKAHDMWFTLTVLCSRGYILLDDDKWAYCSYDMFKTQRALFTVQAFVRAQCFWPDKWEPMNCLGWSFERNAT